MTIFKGFLNVRKEEGRREILKTENLEFFSKLELIWKCINILLFSNIAFSTTY